LEQKADILAAGIKLGEVLGEVLEAWPKEAIGSLGDHHSMEAILHSLTSKQGMLDAKVNLDKAMTAVEHALKELDDATGDTYHWVDAKNRANQAQAHLIATQKQAVVAANEAKAAVLDAKNRANLAVRNVDREVKWQEGTVQHLKKELGKEEVKVVKAKKAHQEAKPGRLLSGPANMLGRLEDAEEERDQTKKQVQPAQNKLDQIKEVAKKVTEDCLRFVTQAEKLENVGINESSWKKMRAAVLVTHKFGELLPF